MSVAFLILKFLLSIVVTIVSGAVGILLGIAITLTIDYLVSFKSEEAFSKFLLVMMVIGSITGLVMGGTFCQDNWYNW